MTQPMATKMPHAADHDLWPEPIDQIAFDRHQPCFGQHENRKGNLDRCAPPVIFMSIGLTNSVQPYCRLAIITMQTMPQMRKPQRVAGVAISDRTIVDAVVMFSFPAKLVISLSKWLSAQLIISHFLRRAQRLKTHVARAGLLPFRIRTAKIGVLSLNSGPGTGG